uniref:Uncharacterized protein n=1 Tax=Arundo donax TaxID=35708 RepID=A0A0A9HXU4_ARUDO
MLFPSFIDASRHPCMTP